MTTKNVVTTEYIQTKTVFADIFNFFLFNGTPGIDPDNLRVIETKFLQLSKGTHPSSQTYPSLQKPQDILCLLAMADQERTYLLLGIDQHSNAQYALPARNMFYEALQYRDQIKQIHKKHRLERENPETSTATPTNASLNGFYKDDRLHPVITLILYLGSDPWKGPRSLHDILYTIPSNLLKFIPNYHLNLVAPSEITDEDFAKFKTNLGEILYCIKHANHQQKILQLLQNDRFSSFPIEAARLLNEFTNLNIDLNTYLKEGVVDLRAASAQLMAEMPSQEMLPSSSRAPGSPF